MDTLQEKLGARIRAFRIVKGYSREELAHLAELNTNHLGRMERGELNFTMNSLEKVMNALDVSPSFLFQFEASIPSVQDPLIEKTIAYMKNMSIEEQKYIYKTAKIFYRKRDQKE